MTQRASAYILSGGLDQTTQALAVPRGRCIGVRNLESVSGGYARTGGYERYDGRQSPTDAFLLATTGNERAARDAARLAIGAVPGSGPIRGVASFKGKRYAWRDNAGGTLGVMHVATVGGWVPVPMGRSLNFTSGSVEIVPGNTITGATSSATGVVQRVVVTDGTWQAGTASGYMVLGATTGAFVAENLKVGANADVATVAGNSVPQGFAPGGRYYTENTNFYGASNLKEMYGVNGVGPGFAFDGTSVIFIRSGMTVDKPNRVRAFKRHLFMTFPGGSVQHSETGEPLQWSAVFGAGEIAVGADVTDLIVGTNALHILTVDQINTLTGNDAADWVLDPLSNEEGHGAIAHTGQVIGNPMYMDVGGIRSIASTQAYGNFKLGSLTQSIQPTINAKRKAAIKPTASVVTKGKDQYRVFYADGTGISIYFGRKYPEPMLFDLGRQVTCICTELDVDTGERTFFGSTDGFVYEMDVGTSFDGAEIVAFIQMPWDNEGSSDVLKRWHKVTLEMDAAPDTKIGITAEFDYANGQQGSLPTQQFTVSGGGGFWDIDTYNNFYWSSPSEGRAEVYIDGQGENMSLIIASSGNEQIGYVLSSVRKLISVRGQKR